MKQQIEDLKDKLMFQAYDLKIDFAVATNTDELIKQNEEKLLLYICKELDKIIKI